MSDTPQLDRLERHFRQTYPPIIPTPEAAPELEALNAALVSLYLNAETWAELEVMAHVIEQARIAQRGLAASLPGTVPAFS